MRALLKHRGDLERSEETNDRGYLKKTWAIHQGNVRCLFQERRGSIVKASHGETLEYDGVLYLPRNLDVKPRQADDAQDRIKLTRPTSFNNVYLLILFVSDLSERARGFLKAFVKRVAPEPPP